MNVALAFAVFVFVVVAFFVISALNVSRTRRALLRQRIEEYTPRAEAQPTANVEVLKTERPTVIQPLERLVGGGSSAENISLEMVRADLPLRPGEYVALRIAVAAVMFITGAVITGNLLIGILALPLGYLAVGIYVKRRQSSRINAFEKQLPEAIELLNTSLRSGFGLLQGLEAVAREMPRPIKDEFSQIVRDMSVGMQLDEALQAMSVRVPSRDVDLLVTAVLVHRTVGGNLAEVMAGIARTIRARLLIRAEVHALTTMPRVSSYIVAVLPFFIVVLMYVVNAAYISLLWTTSLGQVLLGVGGTLTALGLFISNRIIQFDY